MRYHSLNTKLEFTHSTAEEVYTLMREADLVVCAELTHLADPDGLVVSAAKMLRPGGTLAINSY